MLENRLSVSGWSEDETIDGSTRGSGFDAAVFAKDDGSEIVISFRGTDFGLDLSDWVYANVPGAFGEYSSQVMRAIEFVADALAAHPNKTADAGSVSTCGWQENGGSSIARLIL